MKLHTQRWITGIVLVPPLVALILYGSSLLFSIVITLVIIWGVFEYNTMIFKEKKYLEKTEGLIIGLCIPLAAFMGGVPLMSAAAAFSLIIVLLIFLTRMKQERADFTALSKVVFGFMYIPFLMSHLILLRHSEGGIAWIFFIIFAAFLGDISAFYVGRSMGKNKLIPTVSAGKTVEGAVGGIAGTMLGCVLFKIFFLPDLSFIHAITLGFMGSLMAQLGDLCESALKRTAMVKDSGTLLPGHGGILDRLDALLFLIPFVYYYRLLVIR